MNRLLTLIIGASLLGATGAPCAAAAQESKAPMHMHKVEMDHTRPDKQVSAQYKSEAATLREKAAEHRKMAQGYRARAAGKINYAAVAAHCDKLAENHEAAAASADAVATELGK